MCSAAHLIFLFSKFFTKHSTCSSLTVQDQVSHLHKTCKIVAAYIIHFYAFRQDTKDKKIPNIMAACNPQVQYLLNVAMNVNLVFTVSQRYLQDTRKVRKLVRQASNVERISCACMQCKVVTAHPKFYHVCRDAGGLVCKWCLMHLKYAVLQCIPGCFQHSPHVHHLRLTFEGLPPEQKTLML
jgi:hypothetical protein